MANAPIIAFDYDSSPYGQKIRTVLAASGISFQRSAQPVVLPRPILEKLDITYRRIPLLALGKDVYCDSSIIIDEIQTRYGALATTPADKAYEAFGIQIFNSALNIVPAGALTPAFIKDRTTIFPGLNDPNIGERRPSGLAEMKAKFRIIENDFLGKSSEPFIAGDKFGLADLHAGWAVGWTIKVIGLGQEIGFKAEDFPRIYKWISAWPTPEYTDLAQEEVWEVIKGAEYTAKDIGFDEQDPLGIKQGTSVTVENSDTEPGAHPQKGRLVGLNKEKTVIELKNGLRIHFPRIGYVVKEAKVGGIASRFSQ